MAQSVNDLPTGGTSSEVNPVIAQGATTHAEDEKTLPLPGWLTKLYFIFPIVLYLPDAIFNYYVYSDGVSTQAHSMIGQAFWAVVWGFVAIGVVGMAYLLSVLAPWHWSQGHFFQALFCAIGVIVATVITTWNSLAYRSQHFVTFPTDTWANAMWPQLQTFNFSLTMVLVSVAPPFWGLFWAIVQPTQRRRDLRHLENTYAERVMRTQQEAKLKAIRAESNAKVREAQLRGMAATASAAREQAAGFLAQRRNGSLTDAPAIEAADVDRAPAIPALAAPKESVSAADEPEPARIFTSSRRELNAGVREDRDMYNLASPVSEPARPQPLSAARAAMAQPSLMHDAADSFSSVSADVATSWPARQQPKVGAGITAFFPSDNDAMTGTTGPRPAIRRGAELSPLLRTMNEPNHRSLQQVDEVVTEMKAQGLQPVPRDVMGRLQEKYGVDETTARKMTNMYRTAKKENRI